ncbi:MAG: S-layer homology domain-containing protein [Clostridia bacterium]|nr:S-layer homology domain-containing protein [Clostridia bacterium]
MKKALSLLLALIMTAAALAAALPAAAGELFSDVDENRWSYESIKFAYENGYMLGVGGDRFDPSGTMNRAMVVTVLWRRDGSPAVDYSPVFGDVKDGKWYTTAVLWAQSRGVVNGTSDTTFSPEGKITREQLVTMLFRYADYKKLDTGSTASIAQFPDADAVSGWAKAAVVWATDKGIIKGNRIGDKDYIAPKGKATREQFAAIIQRFCDLFDPDEPDLKEDPIFDAASKMRETLLCDAHGALHAEFGAPETLNESALSAMFVSALGLDISIYKTLFREDELSSLISGYAALSLGEKLEKTVRVRFINDRLFDEDWRRAETEEQQIPLILRRGYSTLSPKLIGCPEAPMRDEALCAALSEIGSLLCPEHGVLHARGGSFSEEGVGAAILGLLGLDASKYSVRIDGASLDALNSGAQDPADLTFSVVTKALEEIDGAAAETDPVTVSVSVIRSGDGFAFVDCPYRAEKALAGFEEKYLCADHGAVGVSLPADKNANEELTALVRDALDLGDGYNVAASLNGNVITLSAESADGTDRATRDYPASVSEGETSRFVLCDCDKDAYQFIYHTAYYGWGSSGWSYDLTANANLEPGVINDVRTDDSSALIRDINVTSKGKLTFRTGMTFTSGFDGAVISLANEDGGSVLELVTKNGSWCVRGADGSHIPILGRGGASYFGFEINVDLYEENAEIWINGVRCGTYGLIKKGINANIASFSIGSTVEDTVSFTPALSNAEANYSVYEQFAEEVPLGSVPAGWEASGAYCDSGANVSDTAIGGRWDGSMGLDRRLRIGAYGSAYKKSYPVDGPFNAEFSILPDLSGTDFAFVLKNGGDDALNISFDDRMIRVNGTEVYEYVKNVPYDIRLEVTGDGAGTVKINGIKRATVPLAADLAADAVSLRNYSSGDVWIDDVYLYETYEHPDYVPAPVAPEDDGYTLGLNVCNLWYNGDHLGWDCITPHDDVKPVLGFYDEGSSETADWEIKYLVEHGVDFEAVCFYAQENNAPLTTRHNVHLNRGFKNAKYSDMMKYCLLWETANALYPVDMNSWKTYFVPYFIEHYFKDPRYMTIENKLVIGSFGEFMLGRENGYWSDERMLEAEEYLNEEVRKLGFDGVIYIASGSVFDASYSYGHGKKSYDPNHIKEEIEISASRAAENGQYYIPTLCVGFNNVGWDDVRAPLISEEDFRTISEWVRDEYGKEHPVKETWQENLVWLSNWNEYGEGTYIMPSEGHIGFAYLDVLRDVFTGAGIDPSLNTVPTEKQLSRIGRLFPQDRVFLYSDGRAEYDDGVDDPIPFGSRNYEENAPIVYTFDPKKDIVSSAEGVSVSDGKITNTSNKTVRIYLRFPNAMIGKHYTRIIVKAKLGEDNRFLLEYGNGAGADFKRICLATDNARAWMFEYVLEIPSDKITGDTLKLMLPPNAYVESVTVLNSSDSGVPYPCSLTFNGKDQTLRVPIETSPSGDVLIGYCQKSHWQGQGAGMFEDYSVWDKETGRLTLEWTGGKTMVFTVGSSFYYDEGVKKYLGYELYEVDGVPMIPVDLVAEGLGLTLSFTGRGQIDVR